MKSRLFSLFCSLVVLAACSAKAESNYSVTIPVDESFNNTMAYLIDWDSSQKLDSVMVSDGVVKFSGYVEEPFIGRLYIGGGRGPIFIVEPGDVNLDANQNASGTPLNERLESYNKRLREIEAQFKTLDQNDSVQLAQAQALEAEYNNLPSQAAAENKGNLAGLYWFLQQVYDMDLDVAKLDALIADDPILAKSKRVESFRNSLIAKSSTSFGSKYKDFSVNYDGKVQKLSDYVKPGEYTLVDFWASWCGPCIRQTKYLKEIYKKYHEKGLNVVGVAVWDEPENTLRAIQSHDLPWPNIIDAQTGPTDLYGISSIPCIILINPEGVIVSRDRLGEELVEDVEREMESFLN